MILDENEIEWRKKMSMNSEMEELKLRGKLIEVKNKLYNEIDTVIWDKRKVYKDWEARFAAITDMLGKMHNEMSGLIVLSGLYSTTQEFAQKLLSPIVNRALEIAESLTKEVSNESSSNSDIKPDKPKRVRVKRGK